LFGGDIWGRVAAWYLRIPVVTTEHNINQGEGMMKRFLKILTRKMSESYVACSVSVRSYVQEIYGVKKSIDVIHYGVHLENLSALPAPQVEKQRLLILGRLTKQKGHVLALRALANIEYILKGTILSLGYSNVFDQAFDRVHISNMSKACNDETEVSKTLKHYEDNYNTSAYAKYINGKYLIYRREDNKVLKSINYQAVKLDDLCL
jgi:glycosyltransferase involved in cell wall biosynthesis